MSDFEKMIREMVANGANMEDIAKATGDTLNAIQKEQNNGKALRQKRYDELAEKFRHDYNNGRISVEDVGILAALVAAPSYPDWTVEDINEFVQGTMEMVKMRAEMIGKNPIEGVFKALDMAAEWSKEKIDAMQAHMDEAIEKNAEKRCGTDRKCTCKDTRTDAEKVRDFLRQFR